MTLLIQQNLGTAWGSVTPPATRLSKLVLLGAG
jgi:hypothetical protein